MKNNQNLDLRGPDGTAVMDRARLSDQREARDEPRHANESRRSQTTREEVKETPSVPNLPLAGGKKNKAKNRNKPITTQSCLDLQNN